MIRTVIKGTSNFCSGNSMNDDRVVMTNQASGQQDAEREGEKEKGE